ncbi:MAG: bifunctional 2-keto-4-hydroxyglutarate aldolase/2-keto-3-deoxy-6-phosphogluconate aldolase [Oenococcus sp.]|uniref:bifunctional 2-keto-4-hydroxyglutarate aldolase/2-keto-3-deoxy-6-phosphogluconate aldolase n=1 Tax=Oenococcus TaxID=46254 RepID=UPI0021E74ACD|nr:bifunctional 2-keto-4-hydroxyglutarate aldolase/2-keto-3-deoxy-6-phosphogluconate aldolase [Oenococcus kitaharae]MCV3296008.1 bifunctional 2-keto-4-hydroxyglutarate aldolase/2-keto-3-deoxy-6-phosphogluconate aldolase [Oenococcus kitaharae]
MQKIETLRKLMDNGIVAVVRGNSVEQAQKTADAVVKGGIKAIELTFTVPHADKLIDKVSEKYVNDASVIIGAGTVLDSISARIAILAGAQFIVSPSFDKQVLEICNLYAVPYLAGAQSLSEIQRALAGGVDIIKLFPGDIATPKMVTAVKKGPLPQANLMPTGGVNIDNMAEWFEAGVVAVGTGGSLTKPAEEGNYEAVTQNAQNFSDRLNEIKHD